MDSFTVLVIIPVGMMESCFVDIFTVLVIIPDCRSGLARE
jgi:hypothetical protein